jgi:hypothetical protein
MEYYTGYGKFLLSDGQTVECRMQGINGMSRQTAYRNEDELLTHRLELLQSGLAVVSELEEQTGDDSSPQLARSHIARAGQKVRTYGFSQSFSKAIRLATSVAVTYGYDGLAEDARKLLSDDSWLEYSTIEKQDENIHRACELVVDEPFADVSSPDELVRRTESVLDELDCEVRTDYDDAGWLFFVDVADSDCAGVVEMVLDELEWHSSFCYRESEDGCGQYEASYVGEFTRYTIPTTKGEQNEL